ncbi:hypothetical protein PHLCEN_2v11683 [Hermanssonia centrifuga]|uniref:Uncharacterized protein n=1 Tax=Hermanssonia centrifuga TaxID=98765 RepID=A0A2R6NJC4_9APHY|nr:hypothetical protein PHLCEN_2v11683 [Hermanssonia centrifuga]
MKFEIIAVLSAYLAVANAHDGPHAFRGRHANIARQVTASASAASSATSSAPSAASSGATPASAASVSAPTVPAAVTTPDSVTISLPTGPSGIPPLVSLTSGMPSGSTLPLSQTFAAGAEPSYSGAPPLPSAFMFVQGQWPAMDVVAPTNSSQVQQWMQELEGVDIPDLQPTQDGDCATDPAFALDGQNRGWWTCGGWTRDTDIVQCPDKLTWGVSFDDGPSPYTQFVIKLIIN